MSEPKTPSTSDPLQQYQNQSNQWSQNTHWIRPQPIHVGGTCPACGYCRHCGRGGYVAPYNPWPSHPFINPLPYQPYYGVQNTGGFPYNNC
jgi:hypothetical protein